MARLDLDGIKVERVSEYKYLGMVLDNKLYFNANTQNIHKKMSVTRIPSSKTSVYWCDLGYFRKFLLMLY